MALPKKADSALAIWRVDLEPYRQREKSQRNKQKRDYNENFSNLDKNITRSEKSLHFVKDKNVANIILNLRVKQKYLF